MPDAKRNGEKLLNATLAAAAPATRRMVAASFFVNLLALAAPAFSLQVFDRVIGHNGRATLFALALGLLVAFLFDFLFRQARSRYLRAAAATIDVELGQAVTERFLRAPLRTLESQPTSTWTQLFRDVETIRNVQAGPARLAFIDLPFAAIFVGVVALVAPPMALALFAVLPVFAAVAWASERAIRRRADLERAESAARDATIGEIAAARAQIKSLGLEGAMADRWAQGQARVIAAAQARGAEGDLFQNLLAELSAVALAVLTTVGALAVLEQQMTMGGLIAANILASRAIAPVTQLVGAWRAIAQAGQARRRLAKFLTIPSERDASGVAFAPSAGRVTLDQARFAYREDAPRPTLDSLSLRFGPGGLHVIVGPNGSGKSTLLKLARGLYRPTGGRVLIDEADIAQFAPAELSRFVGYLPQDCTLFAGTIRENLTLGRDDVDDAALLRAARNAGAHELIASLPDGYGAQIGEGGAGLSGGMRQRIALARALLGEPPVILLDEPSSNLDREAEAALVENLKALSASSTIVAVSHSLALLAAADSVLVLSEGRAAMAGPAAQILPRLKGAA